MMKIGSIFHSKVNNTDITPPNLAQKLINRINNLTKLVKKGNGRFLKEWESFNNNLENDGYLRELKDTEFHKNLIKLEKTIKRSSNPKFLEKLSEIQNLIDESNAIGRNLYYRE